MTGKERRDSIIKMISDKSPVSGGSLSKSLDVSRQIIEQLQQTKKTTVSKKTRCGLSLCYE